MKCTICGKEIKGYGNNPAPIAGGACCDECRKVLSIPTEVIIQILKIRDTGLTNSTILYHFSDFEKFFSKLEKNP